VKTVKGRGDVRIGTSGWHYKHWHGPFYPIDLPSSRMLAFYLDHLNTVEINNSFYRLPLASTFETWRRQTPPDFCFAVKASRYLTHMKKLRDPEAALERFLPLVELLGDKLGPVLFQLPPHWRCDTDRLLQFLRALPRRHRYSFEFRDPTWHRQEIYELLERHNAAFCMYELAGFRSPTRVTADFAYVRLHGPATKAYQGSYDSAALTMWRDRIWKWQSELKAVYVYFDNDQSGYAVQNALQLKNLVHRRSLSQSA
jgi:uncharacterized protein YecE (DUF72 family)